MLAARRYLGETFGVDAGLYPELGPKRGEAMKWIVWSNVSMAEPAARMMRAMGPSKAGAACTSLSHAIWLSANACWQLLA